MRYTLVYIHYPTMPGIHLPVYTPSIPPWVHPSSSRIWCSTGSSGLGVTLPGGDALGSKEEKPLGEEAFLPLRILKV